jgi:hypothetical protein
MLRFLFPCLSALLLAPALCGQVNSPLYYVQVGAGSHGEAAFRTVFHVTNESLEDAEGQLWFFNHEGSAMDLQVTAVWTGSPGELQTESNRAVFKIVPKSSLILTMISGNGSSIGWAKFEGAANCLTRAVFQYARAGVKSAEPIDFEDRLVREAEVFPVTGLKHFSFPLALYRGSQEINTAFALVNLSSEPADVALDLRPDQRETITIEPGRLFSSYFTDLWQLDFPAIFPLRVDFGAEVQSTVPLAVTVFKTMGGIPLSGIPATQVLSELRTIAAELGKEFQLSINQTAQINTEKLTVTFWNLTEESRCPIGATCVWEGQASVVVRVNKESETLGDITLTSRAGNRELATREIGGYTIELLEVTPVPELDQNPIGIDDYVITLLVSAQVD